MQQVHTQTQQSTNPTPISATNPQHDPVMVSAAVSIFFPFLVAMMISGYRKHRAARLREQIARLEKLWSLSPRR